MDQKTDFCKLSHTIVSDYSINKIFSSHTSHPLPPPLSAPPPNTPSSPLSNLRTSGPAGQFRKWAGLLLQYTKLNRYNVTRVLLFAEAADRMQRVIALQNIYCSDDDYSRKWKAKIGLS